MIFVTGAAGFIGAHLCRRLLKEGYDVTGVDSFTDSYPRWMKEKNIQPLKKETKFRFIANDLNGLDLRKMLRKTEYVFHLAAQAGVRTSWGENFYVYTKNNIEVTQKLLEASRDLSLKKFIYASSSSVYGRCPELPMSETSPVYPFSPYGVTKLAAEHLCFLYHHNYSVPSLSLRFFTVYGPGQRPDMAFHKFFKSIFDEKPIYLYGDGQQTRDFTYIDDIIEANFSCLEKGKVGEIYNIGGGNQKKLTDIIPLLEEITKKKVHTRREERQKGDVLHTYSDIRKAQKVLDYWPQTRLQDGLQEEWKWIQTLYGS